MSTLLTTTSLGGLHLANRVCMAPMTRARCGDDGVPTPLVAEYYRQRSGAGLIISEGTSISDHARGWQGAPGIFTDAQVNGWKEVVTAVHEQGTPIFLQLWHCGRASHSSFHADGTLPIAPSPVRLNGEYIHTPMGKQEYEVPRSPEVHEIPSIVEEYRQAASRASAAGFDGVEIHGANGYLVDTFLQSRTNRREDAYGGDAAGRFRLLDEILQAVASVMPSERIGVRLSPNGIYNDMGSVDFRESFLYYARAMSGRIGYLHVMDGLGFGFHELGEPMQLREFRSVFSGTLIGNCGYSRESAESALAAGDADLISFGRPFISNPDLVNRFRHNLPLAEPAGVDVWYSPGPHGYTDFPALAGA